MDPDASTILVTPSPLIKAVTNVLNLTKTLDVFDVEEQPSENLECQCPNVTVEKGYISKLEPSKNASNFMLYYIFRPIRSVGLLSLPSRIQYAVVSHI